jgi:hypothetical protein
MGSDGIPMNVAASRFHANITTRGMVLSVFAPATETVYKSSKSPSASPNFEHTNRSTRMYMKVPVHVNVYNRDYNVVDILSEMCYKDSRNILCSLKHLVQERYLG